MGSLNRQIGGKIRLYRKQKNISMDAFAKLIHKSKATVSKYERGEISIDIETLYEIADTLGICPTQLLSPSARKADRQARPFGIMNNSVLYLYFYDGRIKKLVRGLLQVFYHESGDKNEVTLYLDIDAFSRFTNCRMLYFGSVTSFDTVTNLTLYNQSNTVEQVNIILLNPFEHVEFVYGLMCGISSKPVMPIALKCAISAHALTEDERLMEQLLLSQEDVRAMKKYNLFTCSRP